MTCMEVWGGNRPVDSGVVMAGLDAWVYSKPYAEAEGGGDVHYVSSCATGRITRMMIADVSGHGQSVASVADELRLMMRRYINYLDQRRFVDEMNTQFAEHAKVGGFATAVVTTFFAPTNDLTISNAGHPPPFVYRASNGQWSILDDRVASDSAELPLGVDGEQHYSQTGERLKVGDLVLCYTDAFIEARNPQGELLQTRGLLEVVASIELGDASTFIERLLTRIRELHGGNLVDDDVTALLFRPNGLGPNVPLRDRMLAPLRMIKSAAKSLRRGEPLGLPEVSIPTFGGALFTPLNRIWSKRNRRPRLSDR